MKKLKQYIASYQNLILLMLAGETIFLLPFVLARIFRPTFLSVLELSNAELGGCFSVYGIVALFSYFLGGFAADRFSPGKLMGVALLLTAAGGFYLATLPTYSQLLVLFGYWGCTTIFLFWAAMIKATRIWGGEKRQGRAFGFLEAGRGLVASSIGIVSALIFSGLITDKTVAELSEQNQSAFQAVIVFASVFTVLVGVLVFFKVKNDSDSYNQRKEEVVYRSYWKVLQTPSVLMLMLIILTAYVGYKSTDFISQYANVVLKYGEGESAEIGALFLYLRPLIAVGIGLLADRTQPALWILAGFLATLSGALLFATNVVTCNITGLFLCSTIILGAGVYATRTLYFTLLKEGNIPVLLTGVAVSVVSVVGYLPDIFMGPLTGYYLDNYPGQAGFQWVFGILASFSFIGLVTTFFFHRINRTTKHANRA